MKKKSLVTVFLALALCFVVNSPLHAALVSTGDLGNNVIEGSSGGYWEVQLNLTSPSNLLPAMLEVKYGLWNGTSGDTVQVSFNGSLLGSFVADNGYVSPGPEFIDFVITGLLLDGLNTVAFQGDLYQDYVVGQVDISYNNAVPAPAAFWLLGSGLVGFVAARRRLQK